MSDADVKPSADAVHPHVRSFVIRAGRMTKAQEQALTELAPKYALTLPVDGETLDAAAAFGRAAPLVVEVGFGMGKSFIEMAAADPARNYLGIEVHPPGVGACLMQIEALGLSNVRVLRHDAYEVFRKFMAAQSIDILQIFFPDPWPKARHHKRRLINAEFIDLVRPLLKVGGEVRMATDWQEYAEEILALFTQAAGFVNAAPDGGYLPRPSWRPLTKFEQRGERLGHGVWDLVFTRTAD